MGLPSPSTVPLEYVRAAEGAWELVLREGVEGYATGNGMGPGEEVDVWRMRPEVNCSVSAGQQRRPGDVDAQQRQRASSVFYTASLSVRPVHAWPNGPPRLPK